MLILLKELQIIIMKSMNGIIGICISKFFRDKFAEMHMNKMTPGVSRRGELEDWLSTKHLLHLQRTHV